MCDVRDVNSDFIVSIFQNAERECVVKILRIKRVDRERSNSAEVASFSNFLARYSLIDRIGFVFNTDVKAKWQAEFRHYRMDFCFIFTGTTQHFNHLRLRLLVLAAPVSYLNDNLVTGLRTENVFRIHIKILMHFPVVGHNERVFFGHFNFAHIPRAASSYDFNNFTFGMIAMTCRMNVNFYSITVNRATEVAGLDVDVRPVFSDLYVRETRADVIHDAC